MKRTVCLFLLLGLLLVMVSPAFAADFTDLAQTQNKESVVLLSDLGLISGYSDGSFRPLAPITREQIAKLMALFCTEAPQTDAENPFSDVADSWALPYISYCASRGLIAGANGLYRPRDFVTGAELLKMLLCALGYDSANYLGAAWRDHVLASSHEIGLLSGFSGDITAPVSRQDACLLIANALQANALSGLDAGGNPVFALDALRNPQPYILFRFQIARYSGVLLANEHADLENGGKLPAGISRLKGHADFAVSTDAALLGHTVSIFAKNGKVYGLPFPERSDTVAEFSGAAEFHQVLDNIDYTVSEDTAYFLGYEKADQSAPDRYPNAKMTVIDTNHDFVFDFVFI